MAQLRLTPRQRMINMMYLVLTALLALNVSKETLDVIAKVDKSLNETIENFTAKNKRTYAAFDNAYALNPVKTGPWKFKADSVRVKTQALIDKINDYKWQIVKTADGRKAQPDTILSMEELNVPAQVMLVEQIDANGKKMSRGKDLKNSIQAFHDFLQTVIDPADSSLMRSIDNGLAVHDIPATLREPERSWEQDNFEYLPLIGIIALMSKMQSDIRNAESDVLNYLYRGIDEESYKFNELNAVVIPKTSKMIFQGDSYEAQIFLSAFDTTMVPEISVGGRALKVSEDGSATYSVTGNSVGKFTFNGLIRYQAPDGAIIPYRFESDYEVIPPSLVVSPTKMNVLFNGLANPVEISVPGVPSNRISATMTHGRIEQTAPGQFNAWPNQDFGEGVVSVFVNDNGQAKKMGDMPFRLRRVPDPIAAVGNNVRNKKGGVIAKNDLMAETGVKAELEGFFFDLKFNVTSFKLSVSRAGFTADEPSNRARFSDAQKNMISRLSSRDRVFIDEIVAVGPDKIPRTLPPLTFTIQ